MKKITIITILLAIASFGFYSYESGSISKPITTLSQGVTYESILRLGMINSHRLDIGQADIK